MAATGSDPARSGATAVGHRRAGFPPPLESTATSGPPPPTSGLAASEPGKDWAAETADAVERLVGSVRAKTSGPLEALARILVYGLVALIVGLAAAVLAAVALVRALDLALPGEVWAAHGLTGGIFVVSGLFLWRKRTVKTVKV
ncbi:MAG: hypothetical protein M3471_01795 [Actinomycetota bacterium]|nr:hypothetical protein [Actinomycetota bacterium]